MKMNCKWLEQQLETANKSLLASGLAPRFLHSTGQAYKGGPNSGVFLQVTADDTEELQVPQQKYTFGIVKAAQARGDLKSAQRPGQKSLARSSRQRCRQRFEDFDCSSQRRLEVIAGAMPCIALFLISGDVRRRPYRRNMACK